jgi:glycosyltransferase involved in cell wall biosynthesis
MKISVCIPQYNRIDFLLYNLDRIAVQSYPNIEVVISDDCSTDDTEHQIEELSKTFRFPIVYSRSEFNVGYDRNLRRVLEMASGEYAVVLGNDDAFSGPDSVKSLVSFLQDNGLPEIGFCNMVEGRSEGAVIRRAIGSRVIGSGAAVALRYYSSFSFVGGLFFKLDTFRSVNTDKADGSIYSQIYLAVSMILKGGRLFCLDDSLVIMDTCMGNLSRGSYKDRIARQWKDFRVVDGGLPSVIHVLIMAFLDSGQLTQQVLYRLFKKTYVNTFPYWIMDYRFHKAFPEAWGLFRGLNPSRNLDFRLLTRMNRVKIRLYYWLFAGVSLSLPVRVLKYLSSKIYRVIKK